jgi:hypothetical protein
MKVFGIIAKIVVALAAIAGIAYVIVTYGDKIVAWFKKVFGDLFYCDCCCDCDGDCENCECDCGCECECDDCDCGEVEVETEVIPQEDTVVAAEGDFEG